MQEIERKKDSNLPDILKPIVKRQFEVVNVNQLPKIMQKAFNIMLTGRKRPVHIDLPMDVQCAQSDLALSSSLKRKTMAIQRGDLNLIINAAKMLTVALRPLI